MSLSQRIKDLTKAISYQVYEKDEIFYLAMLAMLAEESIFLLGKPGIAKSLVSRRLKFAIRGGINFEYLMSKFSTPEEIYGPIDLRELKEGRYVRNIQGYLPSAHVGFLDEIWKAGPSIQNTLLTIINEKIYRNGGVDINVPLKLLISASNELPAEGEGLEALYDRFIIRYIAEGLKDEDNFEKLLDGDSPLNVDVDEHLQISLEELKLWKQKAKSLPISRTCFEFIQYFRQKLERETNGEAYISDRRWKKIAGLMKTSAFFNDRDMVDLPDLFVIPHCIWDNEEQAEKYHKYFIDAFLEQFGLEWRHEKNNLLNQLDDVNAQIGQIEAQFLRLTIYSNPFKGKIGPGTYYHIFFNDAPENSRFCLIEASQWNRLVSLPNEEIAVDLFFGPNNNKLTGKQNIKVRAYKSDQILFVETNKKYLIENDNPDQYNREMHALKDRISELEKGVKDVSTKMYKLYKDYTQKSCIFFQNIYEETIAEAFDNDE